MCIYTYIHTYIYIYVCILYVYMYILYVYIYMYVYYIYIYVNISNQREINTLLNHIWILHSFVTGEYRLWWWKGCLLYANYLQRLGQRIILGHQGDGNINLAKFIDVYKSNNFNIFLFMLGIVSKISKSA